METGSIPTTSIYGTWVENVEVISIDDDELCDLSGLTEITLKLRDRLTRMDELMLTLSNGDIVVPSTGIIQWRVEASAMGTLVPKVYEVILLLDDGTTIVPLIIGSVAVVE